LVTQAAVPKTPQKNDRHRNRPKKRQIESSSSQLDRFTACQRKSHKLENPVLQTKQQMAKACDPYCHAIALLLPYASMAPRQASAQN
jgi:hypothetical protein